DYELENEILRAERLRSELVEASAGKTRQNATFAITDFVMDNWNDVAFQTNVLTPTDDSVIFYMPIRNVPPRKLTASGPSKNKAVDACLQLEVKDGEEPRVRATPSCEATN